MPFTDFPSQQITFFSIILQVLTEELDHHSKQILKSLNEKHPSSQRV